MYFLIFPSKINLFIMDTPLTWTLRDCNPHGICNDGFNCTVHLFPVHILYLLCIECLLEEYHNKTMFLGEINLIAMQMFIVLLFQHGCCEHTLYILNSQIERNYVYWLLWFFTCQ